MRFWGARRATTPTVPSAGRPFADSGARGTSTGFGTIVIAPGEAPWAIMAAAMAGERATSRAFRARSSRYSARNLPSRVRTRGECSV